MKRLDPAGKDSLTHLMNSPIDVIPVDAGGVRTAVDILAEHAKTGIGGRDAAILASMRAEGITTIMTHDKAFGRIPGIRIIDPVLAK